MLAFFEKYNILISHVIQGVLAVLALAALILPQVLKTLDQGLVEYTVTQASEALPTAKGRYYTSVYYFKHIKGPEVKDVSLIFRANGTSDIADYDYQLGSLRRGNLIDPNPKIDKNLFRLDLDRIRPKENFNIQIFSQTKPEIAFEPVLIGGEILPFDPDRPKNWLRDPVIIIASLIGISYLLFIVLSFWRFSKFRREIREARFIIAQQQSEIVRLSSRRRR